MGCIASGTGLHVMKFFFTILFATDLVNATKVRRQSDENPVPTSATNGGTHGYFAAHNTHGNWSYEEMDDWNEMSPTCANGRRQSPINLDSFRILKGHFPQIMFTGYERRTNWKIRNAGNNLQLTLNETEELPSISGGGLPGTYIFHQVHFHWGSNCRQGSEHLRNSMAFAGEIHIVHHNVKYDNLEEALNYKDGIAVLAVWMKEEEFGGKKFFPLTSQLHKVRRPNTEVWSERTMALADMLPRNTGYFYRYDGSLTTPNCAEVVVWTIFHNPVTLSSRQVTRHMEDTVLYHATVKAKLLRVFQMFDFRQLIDNRNLPMVNNFRPPQPLNGRKVFVRAW